MQPEDFLSLVVEVSITIVGFSGIVIVLGRRAMGEWSSKDLAQFRALLVTSITPIAFSGLGLFLLTTEIPLNAIWRVCSLFFVASYFIQATIGIRRAKNLLKDDIDKGRVFVLLSGATLLALLGLVNAVVFAAFWPLALTLLWLIGVSIFNFVELLWRATVDGHA